MSNHTPGPWHYEESPMKTGWCVVTGNNYLADVHKHVGAMVDDVQDEANARLIASAPELLEALESMVAEFDNLNRALDPELSVDRPRILARAAIAKVKGKPNE